MKAFLIIITSLFVAACSTSGTGLNVFSYEDETRMGKQFDQEIQKQLKIMHDPKLDRYINQLGHSLVSQGIDHPPFEYTFHVVDSSEVNAFAIPGGHVYVNLAVIKEASSEAEMVAIIAHELGHVVLRHGTKRMTDTLLIEMASRGAESATKGSVGAQNAQLIGVGTSLLGQTGLLMYGRNAELEADHTGVEILYCTGYDVHALSSFFKKLLKIEQERGVKRGGLSELLATHPPTKDRMEKAEAYIKSLRPQVEPKQSSPEFDEIKRYVATMTPSHSTLIKGN